MYNKKNLEGYILGCIVGFMIGFGFGFGVAEIAYADPFFCSEPTQGATKYKVTFSDGTHEESDALSDGSMNHDIANWPSGTINGTVQAGSEYVLDGVPQGVYGWSQPPVPFNLESPSTIAPGTFSIKP